MPAARGVVVTTGARLHFGFYGLATGPRRYGGLGLYIDKPGYRIVFRRSDSPRIRGCQAGRAGEILRRVLDVLGLSVSVDIELKECVDEHVGLGSTTQLTLAILSGVARIEGADVDLVSAARRLGIGARSGVGLWGYRYGGLIVDAGVKPPYRGPATLLARYMFPSNWVVGVVIPGSVWRVSGEEEERLLASLPEPPESLYYRALEIVFRRLLPAVVERDFMEFAESVEELDKINGKVFAPVQKGVYACREAELAVKLLKDHGGLGVGQSSWGPAVYSFYDSVKEARETLTSVREELARRGVDARILVTTARNSGARVEPL